MALNLNKPVFVNERDVVLRKEPKDDTGDNAVNHLILGDYVTPTGERDADWVQVWGRGVLGWFRENWLSNDRLLEINFVDIGQGDGCHIVTPDDEVILVDAGEGVGFSGNGGDNMNRFLSWRYRLRDRKVKGVDGVAPDDPEARDPFEMEYAVISHPDMDHYYGFKGIFGNPKLKFHNVCHNGIAERPVAATDAEPWAWDLGRKVPPEERSDYYLWDTVRTSAAMHDLIKAHPATGKFYLSTLREARKHNNNVKFQFLRASKGYLDHFDETNDLQLRILAPVAEKVTHQGETRDCLRRLGSEGETKNGHSIVLKLKFKKLTVLLGGDLNTRSQDYLARYYSDMDADMSEQEATIHDAVRKIHDPDLPESERTHQMQRLESATQMLELIVTRTRHHFQSDIAKACHHGAADVLDSFHRAINPIATVISSGDREPYSHPRPDALGSFGKAGRGTRPLIFSTELARSTREFSRPYKHYEELKALEQRKQEAATEAEKEVIQELMEELRDSNVARYGLITVRTDGERVIIATKLEEPRGDDEKWDIYDLRWNELLAEFEYEPDAGH